MSQRRVVADDPRAKAGFVGAFCNYISVLRPALPVSAAPGLAHEP